MDVQAVIDRVRQLSDNEYGPDHLYLDDSELIGYINTNYAECYRTLLRYKLHTKESTQTINPTGALNYNVNSDILYVKAVWKVFDSGRARQLDRHDYDIRPNVKLTGEAETYRILNGTIEFNPVPNSGTYEIRYIPKPAELTTTTDVLDDIENWEEFVVWATLADVAFKEDLDVRYANSKKEFWRSQMKIEASKQDLTRKSLVKDVDDIAHGNEHLWLGLWI